MLNQTQESPRVRHAQPVAVAQLPDALLRVGTVAAVSGLSVASIYRKVASGSFPKPVRMGARCTRWRAGDVTAWAAAQFNQAGA